MKRLMPLSCKIVAQFKSTVKLSLLVLLMINCKGKPNGDSLTNSKMPGENYEEGSYGFDLAFLEKYDTSLVELKNNTAHLMISPALQGRVMTSSASGLNGTSFGWINYDLYESEETNVQFNPFGGEERFWIGPEGGPFSIYFKKGDEQVFSNWVVPPVIDSEPFEVSNKGEGFIEFEKDAELENASGTKLNIAVQRKISLLDINGVESVINMDIPNGLKMVAYETDNTIINKGEKAWTKKNGLLSIWLLCMFTPSPSTTVFIPFAPNGEGTIVNDEYFGKIPSERLVVKDSVIYFKIDGEYRSKIGVPPTRARNLCGSYDSAKNILTLLWCSLPEEDAFYVNSTWGEQEDPYSGDVINSYNDGPVEDGSIMGPFYEIETSSPAKELKPGESINHIQRVMHFEGDKQELEKIVNGVFNLKLEQIVSIF